MKGLTSRHVSVTATALLIALSSVCQLSAATNPLKGPRGLALDSRGNLYVANQSGNNVVVFNPNYVWMSSKTISAGLSAPVGVAFDSAGNLYVANQGSQSVTEYFSTGAQPLTITDGINNPEAIAVDGTDNVYIENSYGNVTIYTSGNYPAESLPTLVETFNPQTPIFGIATRGQFFAWGGVNAVKVQYIDQLFGASNLVTLQNNANEGLAVAFDGNGNLYVANADQTLVFVAWGSGEEGPVANLGFVPEGMVVDSVRSRIYISNQLGNSIAVYSLTGTLLKTIQ